MTNKKEKYLYCISKIKVSDKHTDFNEKSFEKILKSDLDIFNKLNKPKLFLGDILGKYSDITVYYDDNEWKIEWITDKKIINAINKLFEYLPKHNRIKQAIDEDKDNDNKIKNKL